MKKTEWYEIFEKEFYYLQITFNKRKTGLLKKAAELAMLCKIQLYLAFTDTENNIILF